MKVALIHNRDTQGVINPFGRPNRETYNLHTVRMVEDALIAGGHNVRAIDGNINVIDELQHFMPSVLDGERMGMVFNMAYGIQGESRYTHIPSLLEMLGIPYVGSNPAGHAIALDKVTTKILLQKAGLPTAGWWIIRSPEALPAGMEFPVIVKPRMEAVSFGLRICRTEEELREAVAFVVAEFSQDALAETFIEGREFCVGLLGNQPAETFPVLEIDLGGDPLAIQSEDDKRRHPRDKICPADISVGIADTMRQLSRDAFEVLGLRDFSRVDFRLGTDGKPWILEVNSMASLGPSGSYVAAAKVAGYGFEGLVNRMLDVAALRCFADGIQPTSGKLSGTPQSLPVRVRAWLRSRQDAFEENLRQFAAIPTPAGDANGATVLVGELRRMLKPLGFQERRPAEADTPFPTMLQLGDGNPEVLFLGRLDMEMRTGETSPFREMAN